MKKRILSIMMAVCMVFSLLPATAYATEGSIEQTEELPALECDCTQKCILADDEMKIEASIKADCPVCGIETSDLTSCVGKDSNAPMTSRSTVLTAGTGGTYATLSEAVTAAADGDTIQIVSELDLGEGVTITQTSLTIDLNGQTIKGKKGINYAVNGGTLNIKDDSGNGKMETSYTTIDLFGLASSDPNGPTVNISGGTFIKTGSSNAVISAGHNSTINIYGGMINPLDGSSGIGTFLSKDSTINFYDGTISSNGNNVTGISLEGTESTCNIYGGTITVNADSAHALTSVANSTMINITGGTLIAKGLNSNVIYSYGIDPTISVTNCIILGQTNTTVKGWQVYGDATLTANAEIPVGKTLTIPNGAKLTIPSDVTLTNNGTIDNSTGGTIIGEEGIVGDGSIIAPIAKHSVTFANPANGTLTAKVDGSIINSNDLIEEGKTIVFTVIPDSGYEVDSWVGVTANNPNTTAELIVTSDATVSVNLKKSKLTPEKGDLIYSLDSVDYDGREKPLSVTAANDKNLGTITVKYSNSTTVPINVGSYTVTVDIAGSTEYNSISGLNLGTYIINRSDATTAMTSAAGTVKNTGETGAAVTLPTKPDGATYGIPTASGPITMTDMSISGDTLTYTASTSNAGETGTITIPVNGANNYKDYSVVVTITSTAKTPQSISFADAAVSKTYGDANFTTTAIHDIGDGDITYASDDATVATVNSKTGEVIIVGVGDNSATITATAAETDTYAKATATYTVTVAKQPLTVTADNKSIKIGGTKPTYTADSSGLVNGETISDITFTDNAPDTNTKGSFIITPTDVTITGGGKDNYDISYVNGTLTINIDVSSIDTALEAANTAKRDVIIHEGEANEIESGKKFVNAAEMQLLDDAIQTATDAKLTVSTITQAEAAAAVLDDGITVFQAAIKLGTKTTSSGGSSNSGATVTPPASNKPNEPTKAEIELNTKVDSEEGAIVNITTKNMTDTIEKAKAQAKKDGKEANGISLVFRSDAGNNQINKFTVNLSKAVQEMMISNKIVSTVVEMDNLNIKIDLDLKAMTKIKEQAKGNVKLTVKKLDPKKLTAKAKTAIGSRPVYDFRVSYGSGKYISNFGDGNVSVSIPYTLKSGEKAGNVYGVFVDSKNKVQWITNSSYDAQAKVLRFSTNHFSTYGVGYKADNTTYNDMTDHWAKNDMEFVLARGLLKGTSTTTFEPNAAITKGMFVTALGKLAGININNYKTGTFTDVNGDVAPYVNWAVSKGIVTGTSATTFSPNQTVTRQEMAVYMKNYAKAMGVTLPTVRTEVTFTDNVSIQSGAQEAVKSMQMAGVIMGKENTLFDPAGIATRAEISSVLRRYVELGIDQATAQGLDVNDSGQVVYYENGKLFTGIKIIDGKTYSFGTDGTVNKIS